MANFLLGQPVGGAQPMLTVTPATPLPPGPNHFDLVVIDDAGNRSSPVSVQVLVQPPAPAAPAPAPTPAPA